MRKAILALASALALAACNSADNDVDANAETDTAMAENDTSGSMLEGEAPGFEALAPGTYEVTRAGGEVDFVEIHDGMTYSRIDADGNATGGSIYMKGGETCFTVEGQEAENCFTDGEVQPDGTMETTNADGGMATVRPVDGTLADHASGTTPA